MNTPNESVSARILSIRAAAGNPCTTCPTCGNPADQPPRRLDERGKIIEGCVDAAHTATLETDNVTQSEVASAAWHFRPVAVRIREQELALISR